MFIEPVTTSLSKQNSMKGLTNNLKPAYDITNKQFSIQRNEGTSSL
jgi:hypothetical protein